MDGTITIWDFKEIDYEGDWKRLARERVTWHAYVLVAMNLGFHNARELVIRYRSNLSIFAACEGSPKGDRNT